MLSMVFTALQARASGAPPISRKTMGAATPSAKFSATVSTAAFVTLSAVRASVSRPTIRLTARRASSSVPPVRARYTPMASSRRFFTASACQLQMT